jgi:hypothetical protein
MTALSVHTSAASTLQESDRMTTIHTDTTKPLAVAAGDEEEEELLVSCRCDSAKAISTLLSCLHRINATSSHPHDESVPSSHPQTRIRTSTTRSKSSSSSSLQPVTIFCSPSSLTFHVYGKAKQIQASVDIQTSLFTDYDILREKTNPEHTDDDDNNWQAGGEFCVNLTTLLECLHIFGTNNLDKTKLCFSYSTTSEHFKMELFEESGILSTAIIPGMLPDDDDLSNSLALGFRSSPIAARIIVKSESLQEIVTELELVAGATKATVLVGASCGIQVTTVGMFGECQITVPTQGRHVVSANLPMDEATTVPRVYALHSFIDSMRAMEIAEETCITMNKDGMMAIQHQVFDRNISDAPSFVDFIMCCLEDESDDEDEQNKDAQSVTRPKTAYSSAQDGISVATTTTNHTHVRVVSQKRYHSENEDEDSEEEEHGSRSINEMEISPPTSSAPRLFGHSSVETSSADRPSPYSREAIHNVRRRTRRRPLSSRSRVTGVNSYNSDASPDLLQQESENEWDESEPLDVQARPSSPRYSRQQYDDRNGDCSSPELLYGRQR